MTPTTSAAAVRVGLVRPSPPPSAPSIEARARIRHGQLPLEDQGAELTPYVLRHPAITRLVERGAPVPTAQRTAGHADVATTMQYCSIADDGYADTIVRRLGKAAVGRAQAPQQLRYMKQWLTRGLPSTDV